MKLKSNEKKQMKQEIVPRDPQIPYIGDSYWSGKT
jgi:hypothetical protein